MNIHKIVAIINQSLKDKSFTDKRFGKASLFGIAVSLFKDKDGKEGYGPFECDNTGEGKWVGFDDVDAIRCYHKNNNSTSKPADQSKQYGDTNSTMNKVYNMSLFVMANRSVIKLSPEELELLINAGFPNSLDTQTRKDFKLNKCSINTVATDFNSTAILQKEYKGRNTLLEPDLILFEFKYTIECQFDKNCINTICCS